ncbi:MAG: hypothetical protein MIO93_12320 [ANME-2 cluster archaeon]|nr:hypothetical protein [ANME-2 cluster archaeon]
MVIKEAKFFVMMMTILLKTIGKAPGLNRGLCINDEKIVTFLKLLHANAILFFICYKANWEIIICVEIPVSIRAQQIS